MWSNDMNAEDYENEVTEEENSEDENFDNKAKENVDNKGTETKIKSENDKETVNESDDKYGAEVKEFNDWYDKRLEEKIYPKAAHASSKKLYDKAVDIEANVECDSQKDVMYMQVPSETRKEDEVDIDMRINLSMIVPLLHAIVAMLLISGKTLQEHRLLVTRLSNLSQLSHYRHHQSEDTVSPNSQAKETCESTIAMLSKVTRMCSSAHAGLVWLSQAGRAVKCVKEEIIKTLTYFLANILIGLGRAKVTIEGY